MIAAFGPLALMIVALAVGFCRAPGGSLRPRPRGRARLLALPGEQRRRRSAEPWVWYLLNVASAAAAIAFPLALQLGWTVLVPALYIVARLAPTGQPSTDAVSVVLDAVFAVILGGVIVALGWMLRSVAVGIDRARRDAVLSYAAAAEADAAEAERVAVAALMHDSVLAALIAAERAATPREEALAVAMAREALTRLANAELDAGEGPTNRCRPRRWSAASDDRSMPPPTGRTAPSRCERTSTTTRRSPGAWPVRSCSLRRRRSRRAFQHADGGWSGRDGAGGCRVGRSADRRHPGAASIRATSRGIASASAVRSWRAWRRSADVRA